MVKRRGPKTDPWGTPSETPEHPDLWFLSCTNCWQSVRYDVNQESAAPVIPMPARRFRSRGCEMVSNAALRSRRMRMVSNPESAARRRLLVILTRAVSVLCFGRKPDWKGSWRLFVSRSDCNCAATPLSSVLEMKGRLEMGR